MFCKRYTIEMSKTRYVLKLFLIKFEFVFHARGFDDFSHGFGTAEENIGIVLLVFAVSVKNFFEKFVPNRSTDMCLCLESSEDILMTRLFVNSRNEIEWNRANISVLFNVSKIQMDIEKPTDIAGACLVVLPVR